MSAPMAARSTAGKPYATRGLGLVRGFLMVV